MTWSRAWSAASRSARSTWSARPVGRAASGSARPAPTCRPRSASPGTARRDGSTRARTADRSRPASRNRRAGGRAADEAGTRPHGQRRGLGRRPRGRVRRSLAGAAYGDRVRGGARARPGRRRGHRRRARDRRRGPRPDRHDRRHRPHASRRDAAGDRAGHRLRGARAGGGDASVGPHDHAACRPLAGPRRGHRPNARRQRPGQPEGRHRIVRRGRAGPRPRARDAGRPLRPRARRLTAMLETFAEVPAYPLVFPVFWGAAAFFVLAMARHLRVFAAVRAEGPSPFADIPARFTGLIRYAFVQTKMFKDLRAGIMHAGIFWGFVLLTIGTANIVTGGIIQAVISIPFDGLLWALISALQNVVAVIVLVSIAWAFYRRLVIKPARLT